LSTAWPPFEVIHLRWCHKIARGTQGVRELAFGRKYKIEGTLRTLSGHCGCLELVANPLERRQSIEILAHCVWSKGRNEVGLSRDVHREAFRVRHLKRLSRNGE
jgi:hypothetical protein